MQRNENRAHIRYLWLVWKQVPSPERPALREALNKAPVILATKPAQLSGASPTYGLYRPERVYVSRAYTSTAHLSSTLTALLRHSSYRATWTQGMTVPPLAVSWRTLGVRCTRGSLSRELTSQEKEKRNSCWRHGRQLALRKDVKIEGLDAFLAQPMTLERALLLWDTLQTNTLPASGRRWYRWDDDRRSRSGWQHEERFDTSALKQLIRAEWLPDQDGTPCRPSVCSSQRTSTARS